MCEVAPAFAFMRGCPCCAALPPIESIQDIEPSPLLGTKLLDSHSHVHKVAIEVKDECDAGLLPYNAVLAIEEACWDAVLARCAINPLAAPGLGVHPWFVHEVTPGWAERLHAKLAAHPGALVGEIGLCKCARNLRGPGAKARVWPLQVEAFTTQLGIGGALQRPASVHCVKAHSTLLEVLRRQVDTQLPPAIALHSFSGTADDVRRLVDLQPSGRRLYFGFSHTVNVAMGGAPGSPAHAALLEAISAVPEDRLLVESDCDSQVTAIPALHRAVQLVASARGWTVERAAERTTANGLEFLQSGACSNEARELFSRRQAELATSITADDPSSALRATARAFRDAGVLQAELYAMLDLLRAAHDGDPDETIYDAVLETMDLAAGWGPRGEALYDRVDDVRAARPPRPRELHPTWPSACDAGAEGGIALQLRQLQAQWRYWCAILAS